MKRPFSCVLLLSAVGLLPACSKNNSPQACTLDTDCSGGLVCLQGKCIEDPCSTCNAGEYCDGHQCTACETAAHCGASCTNCQSQATNHACVDDRCGCDTAHDCASGEVCHLGTCQPAEAGDGGLSLDGGAEQDAGPRVDGGLQGDAGRAQGDGGVPCQGSADCDDENDCTDDSCVQGACLHTPKMDGTACDDHNACTNPDTCTSGICFGAKGTEGPAGDPTCSDGIDNDCDGRTDGDDPSCDPNCTVDEWCKVTGAGITGDSYESYWAASPQDAWLVGWSSSGDSSKCGDTICGLILHNDGTGWRDATVPNTPTLSAVWGTSSSNVWAVGYLGTILRWDGSSWHTVTAPNHVLLSQLFGLSGCAEDDIWATGGTATWHWDGANWSTEETGRGELMAAVWCRQTDDVWFVGNANDPNTGLILHWDGQAFAVSAQGMPWLQGIWSSSKNDVWAVGNAGVIQHFDGTAWSAVGSPTQETLVRVWGTGANDVYAVGTNGSLVHFDGAQWRALQSGTTNVLKGIWGPAPDALWIAGWSQTLLQLK